MASRSGRQGAIPPETKALMKINSIETNEDLEDQSFVALQKKVVPEGTKSSSLLGQEEGCRVCHQDEDHANLLICEACNAEYHTYCLKPPLQSVPDDDWFCDKCKRLHLFKDDDGLDGLVSALPPSYTSRFGEIVWAAGGQGFGWWPACIYDPRLTVGGARQLARKNLGKRHLVYFFECYDAPFTVLSENRLTKWDDGFLEEYDLGKAAKSGSKGRTALFDRALNLAQLENGKPIEMRMDWNHQWAQTDSKMSKTKLSSNSGSLCERDSQPPIKRQKSPNQCFRPQEHSVSHNSSFSTVTAITSQISSQSVNRTNVNLALKCHSSNDGVNAIEPFEDGRLVCKILRKLSVTEMNSSMSTEGFQFSVNVGFITLPSRQSATFACVREAVERELDDDCFPRTTESNAKGNNGDLGIRWKFYVPKLGPVSVKQESKLGPVLDFLKSTVNDNQIGNGTPACPLKVVIMDC